MGRIWGKMSQAKGRLGVGLNVVLRSVERKDFERLKTEKMRENW